MTVESDRKKGYYEGNKFIESIWNLGLFTAKKLSKMLYHSNRDDIFPRAEYCNIVNRDRKTP